MMKDRKVVIIASSAKKIGGALAPIDLFYAWTSEGNLWGGDWNSDSDTQPRSFELARKNSILSTSDGIGMSRSGDEWDTYPHLNRKTIACFIRISDRSRHIGVIS
jgi:hypothetical protein